MNRPHNSGHDADDEPLTETVAFRGLTRYEQQLPVRQVSYYLCGEILEPQFYTELFHTLRTASEAEQARTTQEKMQQALAQIQQSAALQARAYALGESPLADLLLARRNTLEAQLAADTAALDAMQAHAKVLLDAHRLWANPEANGH